MSMKIFGQGASFKINVPDREKTYTKQCQEIIQHLGFKRPSVEDQEALSSWLLEKSEDEVRGDFLIEMAEKRLLGQKTVLPTKKVLKRLEPFSTKPLKSGLALFTKRFLTRQKSI